MQVSQMAHVRVKEQTKSLKVVYVVVNAMGVKAQLEWSYPCFQIRVQALLVPLLTRLPYRHHTSDLVNRKSSSR